jgi:hypothetical protein
MDTYNKVLNDALYRDDLLDRRTTTQSALNHWFVRNRGVTRQSFPVMYESNYQVEKLQRPGNIDEAYWDTLSQADQRWSVIPEKSQMGEDCRDLWKQHATAQSIKNPNQTATDLKAMDPKYNIHGAFAADPLALMMEEDLLRARREMDTRPAETLHNLPAMSPEMAAALQAHTLQAHTLQGAALASIDSSPEQDLVVNDDSTLRLPHRPFGSPKPEAQKENLVDFPGGKWHHAGNW